MAGRRSFNVFPDSFGRRHCGSSLASGSGLGRPRIGRRWFASPSPDAKNLFVPSTPTAQQLLEQGNFISTKSKTKIAKANTKLHDKTRVNIVSQTLCDDIVKYIGPSLERHVGCDILDMYPGSGLWSRTLHDLLQPRSHILMEPDAEFYKPYLEPLLEKPNTMLVSQSGIVWSEIQKLADYLPHQTPIQADLVSPPQRNDTLLVTANLGFYPRKKFGSFSSASRLVLYQLIASIRRSTLFQRYGLVRMLLWVDDDDGLLAIPRSNKHRKKLAVETELSSEWIHVVARRNIIRDTRASKFTGRDYWIDWDSAKQTVARMKAAGISVPKGRESGMMKEVIESGEDLTTMVAGTKSPILGRSTDEEFEKIDPTDEQSKRRWSYFMAIHRSDIKNSTVFFNLLQERQEIIDLRRSGKADPAKMDALESGWNMKVGCMMQNTDIRFLIARDNLHIFQQSPPVLLWDRRLYEPLAVAASEFFPNYPLSLLDIQPKAPNNLLRNVGPRSTRAGDMFELIVQCCSTMSRAPFSSALAMLWPGAADNVLPKVTSLKDPARGGVPSTLPGHFEVTVRAMNQEQWMEFLDEWMKWPFRPSWQQLMSRFGDMNTTREHNTSLFAGMYESDA